MAPRFQIEDRMSVDLDIGIGVEANADIDMSDTASTGSGPPRKRQRSSLGASKDDVQFRFPMVDALGDEAVLHLASSLDKQEAVLPDTDDTAQDACKLEEKLRPYDPFRDFRSGPLPHELEDHVDPHLVSRAELAVLKSICNKGMMHAPNCHLAWLHLFKFLHGTPEPLRPSLQDAPLTLADCLRVIAGVIGSVNADLQPIRHLVGRNRQHTMHETDAAVQGAWGMVGHPRVDAEKIQYMGWPRAMMHTVGEDVDVSLGNILSCMHHSVRRQRSGDRMEDLQERNKFMAWMTAKMLNLDSYIKWQAEAITRLEMELKRLQRRERVINAGSGSVEAAFG